LFVGRLESKWFYYQSVYCLALAGIFWVIGVQFGPNLVNFRNLTGPTPADFKDDVEKHCVAVVRAMKEFERDQGRLPTNPREIVPKYLTEEVGWTSVWQGGFSHRSKWNQYIVYNFNHENEGWYVHGVFASGRIPLPPVKLGPATRPTTQKN